MLLCSTSFVDVRFKSLPFATEKIFMRIQSKRLLISTYKYSSNTSHKEASGSTMQEKQASLECELRPMFKKGSEVHLLMDKEF